MISVSATEIKSHFGHFLNVALVEPVKIRKNDRDLVVLLSQNEYDRLSALEDAYWGLRATLAEQNGFLGTKASERLLHEMMNRD